MNSVRPHLVALSIVLVAVTPLRAAQGTTGVRITVPEMLALQYQSGRSIEGLRLHGSGDGAATVKIQDLFGIRAVLAAGHTAWVRVSIVNDGMREGEKLIRIGNPWTAVEGGSRLSPTTLTVPPTGPALRPGDLRLDVVARPAPPSCGETAVILIEVADL